MLKQYYKLEKIGFSLSLDDFGRGFSSLYYLLRIPANRVEIDKSFIDGLPKYKIRRAYINAT
ncbi:MAG: EAL domain-containing protein [Tatlockia sp.]|nr:EAL domain-containing protein [Tatlockia sp.]